MNVLTFGTALYLLLEGAVRPACRTFYARYGPVLLRTGSHKAPGGVTSHCLSSKLHSVDGSFDLGP